MTARGPDDDQPRVYGLHGLRLRSVVPIVGFLVQDDGYDVDIVCNPWKPVPATAPEGRIVAARCVGGTWVYVAADDGRKWTLRVPGLCDFVIDREGREVECRIDPSADVRMVGVFVAGLLVAFLLGLRGDCVLHASAVEVDGSAVAFAGPSGSGKSTLAALLCSHGARVVTDDVLRVGMGPPPVCVGGSPQLRLRSGASWVLEQFAAPPVTTTTVDQRSGVSPPAARSSSPALSLIVLPRLSLAAEAITVTRVTGAAAHSELAGSLRVAGWRDPDVIRSQFQSLATVADQVPLVEMVLPRDPSWRARIGPTVLDLLSRLR